MRNRLRLAAFCAVATLAALTLSATVPAAPPAADLVITGGRLWTGEAGRSPATALAVADGRIAYVGDDAGALARRGPKTRTLALKGELVTPGFEDAHIHLMSGALSLDRVDLIEDGDVAAIQDRIRRFAAERPGSAWVLGRGWLYGAFPGGMPTREQLDAAVPDRPAYMECYDGHSGWANSRALAAAGITRDTPDPPNGAIVRDARGEPTGALKESATALVDKHVPVPGDAERYELLKRALRLLNSQGVTAMQDAGYTPADLARELPLLERALAEGVLTVRMRASVQLAPGPVDAAAIAEARRLAERHRGPLLRFGAVKGYVDGVIEAGTAALLEPYDNDPAHGRGHPNWEPAALNAAVVEADRAGLQVWLHAIGDRGVRMALDAHEAAARANGPRDRRGRLEHIETIDPADYPRFKALGVIAAMQPLHANPDQNLSDIWSRNLGKARAARGFSWRNVERAGGRLVFGSDWPVVTSDVRRGLFCAVTRKTRDGKPEGGWLPEQAVTLDSALRHYTVDPAYAAFEENERGSLRAGQRADIVVWSPDLLASPPEAILTARVLLTLLDGRVVHRAEGFAPGLTTRDSGTALKIGRQRDDN
jgi:predicted amidohydrolase YtcJ